MMLVIRRALNPNASKGEILNECNRIQIKRSDVLTLDGNSWLNDEVLVQYYVHSYIIFVIYSTSNPVYSSIDS